MWSISNISLALVVISFFFSCTNRKEPPLAPTSNQSAALVANKAKRPTKRKLKKPLPSYTATLQAKKSGKQNRQLKRKMLEQWHRDKWKAHRARRLRRHTKYHEQTQKMRRALRRRLGK